MNFSLIDRILEYREGEGIRAAKTLSLAEEYLADHFPGFPVMPGVLMIEAMTQAAAWYVRLADELRHPVVTLIEVSHVRFGRFVTPGDTFLVDLELKAGEGTTWDFRGKGRVRSQDLTAVADDLPMACQAKLRVRASPVCELAPELTAETAARVEGRLRESMRAQLVGLRSGYPGRASA